MLNGTKEIEINTPISHTVIPHTPASGVPEGEEGPENKTEHVHPLRGGYLTASFGIPKDPRLSGALCPLPFANENRSQPKTFSQKKSQVEADGWEPPSHQKTKRGGFLANLSGPHPPAAAANLPATTREAAPRATNRTFTRLYFFVCC